MKITSLWVDCPGLHKSPREDIVVSFSKSKIAQAVDSGKYDQPFANSSVSPSIASVQSLLNWLWEALHPINAKFSKE